ncbi:MAG: hypothetical protein JW702_01580 [Clostridiales bacterium]|nr:hypothetical protein [Clostridiales bacterium]
MAIELKLKLKDLTWLGKVFEENSMISPFSLINQEGFDEVDKNRLIEMGIVDGENNINAKFYPLFETLSKVDGFVETTLKRGPIKSKKMIMTKDNQRISLAYLNDEVIINSPANTIGMANFLREYTGGSKLTSSDLSLEIGIKEAFVFGAICDLYRKDIFKAYSEEEGFIYNGFSKEMLLEAVSKTRNNTQSLAYHIYDINGGAGQLDADELGEILKSLEEKEMIREENSIYYPAGEGILFAGNFLIVENVIEVLVGQVKEDKLYRSRFTMLQAGPLDLLYLEKSEDKIIMQCLSADNASSFISSVLSEKPDIA